MVAYPKAGLQFTVGFSVLILSAILLVLGGSLGARRQPEAPATPARSVEFLNVVASIHGRIQMLRQFEKSIVANPDTATLYQQKRGEARRRIDELMQTAQVQASSGEERKQLEQLVVMIASADNRFKRILLQLK